MMTILFSFYKKRINSYKYTQTLYRIVNLIHMFDIHSLPWHMFDRFPSFCISYSYQVTNGIQYKVFDRSNSLQVLLTFLLHLFFF